MKQSLVSTAESFVGLLPFKKQIFSMLRTLKPPKRVWNRLRFEGSFKVSVNDDAFFYLNHYGSGFENGIFWRGLYQGWGEEQPLRVWQRLCSEAEVILDIGANVGIYSLVAKSINSRARVYGFEPVEHLHRKFKQSCAINGYEIECVRAALSNENGFADLFIQPGGLATASLSPNQLRTTSERVELTTLASFIETRAIKNIDLMKIDVEGFEPQVLEGMGTYLTRMKPSMIVEILSDEVGKRIAALSEKCGYLYYCLDEKEGPLRQTHLSIKGRSRHSRNFLLCRENVATRLGLL